MNRTEEAYERFRNPPVVENAFKNYSPHMTQQTHIFPNSPEVKSREKYRTKLYGLGITECVLGGLCVILAITTLSVEMHPIVIGLENLFTYTAQGIWDGFFIILTGILGICAKGNPSLLIYNVNMALSIITAVFSSAAVVLSSFACLSSLSSGISLFVLHASISLFLFASLVILIVHSGFCCAGVCRTHDSGGTVVYITQAPEPSQVAGHQNVQETSSECQSSVKPLSSS